MLGTEEEKGVKTQWHVNSQFRMGQFAKLFCLIVFQGNAKSMIS